MLPLWAQQPQSNSASKEQGSFQSVKDGDLSPPPPASVLLQMPITLALAMPAYSPASGIQVATDFITLFLASNRRVSRTMCVDQPSNERPDVTLSDGVQFCRDHRTDLNHRVPRAGTRGCHGPRGFPPWATGDSATKAGRRLGVGVGLPSKIL